MRMGNWIGRKQAKLLRKSDKTPGIKAHCVNMRFGSQNPWKRTGNRGTSFTSSTGKEGKQIYGSLWPVILTYLELPDPVYKPKGSWTVFQEVKMLLMQFWWPELTREVENQLSTYSLTPTHACWQCTHPYFHTQIAHTKINLKKKTGIRKSIDLIE